ncbi:velvet factor-domain-containing protein [Halteromyces radiatus]|uniref:velvet factor-domain-containing protein n=1 Tax=Halteromyces radiatus TaxID=101107 RepID=UPI00221FEE82|nr:velvet factor-domain-containing protein [Halteromyces radiatus]KAI8088829.1 velvet factor-domain-containing protein [Halteromyces radiatus]
MDDTVSYHFASVKQRRENRDEIEFRLSLRQQPKQSRMCGVGEKVRGSNQFLFAALLVILMANLYIYIYFYSLADRRPIDPPPIVQLRVIDPTLSPLEANSYLQNPYYFMYASLMAADLEEEVHLLRDGKTRSTTGSVVSSLYHLKDTDNTDAGFFVFPDLSVRMEGKYRLKLSLFEIIGKEVFHCKSILSDQFIVYSAKKFPGMEESTSLSRSFADQGLKIRIRKELRQRRKSGKRIESDDDSPHLQSRFLDKRPRQQQQQTDSVVPTSTNVISHNVNTSSSSSSLPSSTIVNSLRIPPPPSSQTIYSLQSPYR